MDSNKPHHTGHRQRLKERLNHDPSSLQDYEILELVLGYALPRKDTKPLAKNLLKRYPTFKDILAAKPGDLQSVDGIGPGIITFLKLWGEFWARTEQSGISTKSTLDSPEKVVRLARSRLQFKPIEEFWTIMVDNKNRLLGFEKMSRGTVDQAPVFPREILTAALEKRSSGIILLHNHPGGDPHPSVQDRELTRKIKEVSTALGIRLLDHVIISEDSFFSFQEHGYV
ncbi:DNA repair protein RadC [Desulfonatronospira sp.]|uniref:RadC family protein n=1 Tax=Desulfonatronospira sp. TaxID=1962951 RepID=UPI0025BA23E9|nr:DNA repair protein RadC [Desulfonatronospira sp.]